MYASGGKKGRGEEIRPSMAIILSVASHDFPLIIHIFICITIFVFYWQASEASEHLEVVFNGNR